MFNFKSSQSANADISSELLDAGDFTPERLLTLEYAHDITAQAFDPLTGLLVIGRLLLPHTLPLESHAPYQEPVEVLCG